MKVKKHAFTKGKLTVCQSKEVYKYTDLLRAMSDNNDYSILATFGMVGSKNHFKQNTLVDSLTFQALFIIILHHH